LSQISSRLTASSISFITMKLNITISPGFSILFIHWKINTRSHDSHVHNISVSANKLHKIELNIHRPESSCRWKDYKHKGYI